MISVVSLLVTTLATPGLVFQADGIRTEASVSTPAPIQPSPELTPELRGDIMMARKMYSEAVDFYKPGSDVNAVLANKTGIAYHQLLDLKNARIYYQRAIKLNPAYAEAINNLGTVYYARKSYGKAISQYNKALRLSPNSAAVLSNLGTAYFARKKYDLAFHTYQLALAIDPEVFESRGTHGVLLQDRSVEERAKYYYTLAKTYAKAGVADHAMQYIRRALEQGFKDRQKFLQEPEFAFLQEDVEFKQILATEYKSL